LDRDGAVSVANDRAKQLFSLLGFPEMVGRPIQFVVQAAGRNGTVPASAANRLVDLINRKLSGKVLLCLPANRYYEVSVSAQDERCVLLFEDISERVAAEERINFMARHDTLTALPNRNYFGELVEDDLTRRRLS